MNEVKIEIFNVLKLSICQKIDKFKTQLLKQSLKNDGSIVTEIDEYVSMLIKEKILPHFPNWNFYSEEDFKQLSFPSLVLDPIDGTNELVKMIPECVVSLAMMPTSDLSDNNAKAWVFNPFTKEEYCSWQRTADYKVIPSSTGLISRTEYESGIFSDQEISKFNLKAVGSIAYKLAKLANGDCEFVITKKNKHVWDIAAGTILCRSHGIFMYQNGKVLNLLEDTIYEGPILWCRPEHHHKLISFINEK